MGAVRVCDAEQIRALRRRCTQQAEARLIGDRAPIAARETSQTVGVVIPELVKDAVDLNSYKSIRLHIQKMTRPGGPLRLLLHR
jgi:hypothetical protein